MIKVMGAGAPCAITASRFVNDTRGTVAVIFALVALPLVAVAALAIDYGRASHVQMTLQNAVDAGAGAARRLAGADTDAIRDSFAANFRANLPAELKKTPVAISVDRDAGTITARAAAKVATSLIGIVGISALEVAAETSGRFASTVDGSGTGSSGRGNPAPLSDRSTGEPAGYGLKRPAGTLSDAAERKLRQMGYDLDDPALRRRATEAEARVRELMAEHPGLFRRR